MFLCRNNKSLHCLVVLSFWRRVALLDTLSDFCMYGLSFAKVLSFGGLVRDKSHSMHPPAWSSDSELFYMEWVWTKGPKWRQDVNLSSSGSPVAFFKFFRSKKSPSKGKGKSRGEKKGRTKQQKTGNLESRWLFVSSSSVTMMSHIYNIFELLKNGWSGKQILNLTRQKQVKTFPMTCLGGNTVSTIKKVLWYLCHRCVLQMMSEKINEERDEKENEVLRRKGALSRFWNHVSWVPVVF